MKKEETKISLKGQEYATPRTESVEIVNQGVLCGSGGLSGAKGQLMGFGAGSGFGG